MRVADAPRARALEPVPGAITWGFALTPLVASATRLVTRVRCRVERTLPAMLTSAAMEPAAFVMTRRMLLNVKRRAEGLARHGDARRPASVSAASGANVGHDGLAPAAPPP